MKSNHLQIICFALLFFTCRVQSAPAHGFTSAEADSIQAFLTDHFNAKKGAIVIGLVDEQESRILSAGTLDNGTTNPVDGESVFCIGSVTKTFTTLLLEDMVERGAMSLAEPVAKYLPQTVKPPTYKGREITLLDLATHTSALPFNPGNMSGKDAQEEYESYSMEKMYDFLTHYQLPRAPGTEFEYSNVGMALLGTAISLKAGTNFESLLVERICRPLHLNSTCITLTPELRARLAMAHDHSSKPSAPWKLQAYVAAGCVCSTANDLLKYAAAHAGLSPSKLASLMEQTHVIRSIDSHGLPGLNDKTFFGNTGMDWTDRQAYRPPGMVLLGHGGGVGGYHAWVGFDKNQHRGVVVLTSTNFFSVEAIGFTVLQRLPLNHETASEVVQERVGLGFSLDLSPQHEVRIQKVFYKSAAESAGMVPGLILQRIGEVPTHGRSLTECLELLRADVGGEVRLELVNVERSATNRIELKRQKYLTLGASQGQSKAASAPSLPLRRDR